jgi:hypothetical protein
MAEIAATGKWTAEQVYISRKRMLLKYYREVDQRLGLLNSKNDARVKQMEDEITAYEVKAGIIK